MKFTVYHAEHRCAPCRDMHTRVDEALQIMARDRGIDATGLVEYIDIDAIPELKPDGLTVVPYIEISGSEGIHFVNDGRITTQKAVDLLSFIADRTWTPQATVEEVNAKIATGEFRVSAPSADVVFYRTYSRRKENGARESYADMVDRVITDIVELGELGEEDDALVRTMAERQHALPSGRWLWVGGTEWIHSDRNYSGAYNCTNTTVNSPEVFGLMMELAMMGSGTGAILEKDQVAKLPQIYRALTIKEVTDFGATGGGRDRTTVGFIENSCYIEVGDSRQGWCDAYQAMIDLAMSKGADLDLIIDLTQIRPVGSRLKGFGGTANPVKLPVLFKKIATLLTSAKGRKLTPIECCLLIDEAAACIVAGNIRRSAGMRQFSSDDAEAATAKLGLYSQDEEGNWRVDPVKENLRMANHTRTYHTKPTLQEVKDAVTLQCQSGEGAIQYVPEAIARSNVDLLNTEELRLDFLDVYTGNGRHEAREFLRNLGPDLSERELDHRVMRYGLNPCGEILGEDFHCNLSEVHLNTLDVDNEQQQNDAFKAAALEVAALLFHQFKDDRYAYSRSIDPIVGVSFTGLFDFLVNKYGAGWLGWMFEGRPEQPGHEIDYAAEEQALLTRWRDIVEATVSEFCQARGLRTPNRTTTVQPAGTKSLLTGASSGWHPPKAQRFIRRITLGAHDPVALAAMDAGFSVIPAPSARDEEGNLLNDIYDERSAEWLVEIPTEVPWANLPGCDAFDLHELSARAQFGLWMSVQKHYTRHNTSATIELQPDEIDDLSGLIHEAIVTDEGYISAALLQRFDARGGAFPRLPFEPIDKETYEQLQAEVDSRRGVSFSLALKHHDDDRDLTPSESACSSAACLAAADKAEREGK